jgi:hypothetical protein
MPALAASVDRERRDAAARLHAARTTPPGALFTAGGQTLLRARLTNPDHPDDPHLGRGPSQRETPGPDPCRRTGSRAEVGTRKRAERVTSAATPVNGSRNCGMCRANDKGIGKDG